jgi:hypothetical protein
MRRLFVVVVASMALSGCGSMGSIGFDMFKPSPPPPVTVQLESLPPGALAVTSIGPSCTTPCSVSVPPTPNFTVTFTAPKFAPATVPVAMIINPGDFATPATTTVDPNPVTVELQPLGPVRRAPAKRAAPRRPPPAAAAAPAPAPAASPFPAPTR